MVPLSIFCDDTPQAISAKLPTLLIHQPELIG
jgi:hypothetical protein